MKKILPEKTALFRCRCGHYGFMEVFEEEDGAYWFIFVEEPHGLRQRVSSFFRSQRYISEVLLEKKDIEKLKKIL